MCIYYCDHLTTRKETAMSVYFKVNEDGCLDSIEHAGCITIPDGVKSIGARVFRYCSKLSSVIIPSSVTSIGD